MGKLPRLVFAIRNGYFTAAKILIENGANILKPTPKGNTLLHLLPNETSNEFIQFLLRLGLWIENENSSGKTPLFHAVRRSKFDLAKLLIKNGANCYNRKKFDQNLFHVLPANTPDSFIKYLNEHGLTINHEDKQGFTPLYYGNENLKKLLIENGADLTILRENNNLFHSLKDDTSLDFIKYLLDKGLNLNQKNNDNQTPLITALNNHQYSLAEKFIDLAADLTCLDQFPKEQIFRHFIDCLDRKFYRLPKILVENDLINPNYICNDNATHEYFQQTLLSISIEKGCFEIALLLIYQGADIFSALPSGQNLFHILPPNTPIHLSNILLGRV